MYPPKTWGVLDMYKSYLRYFVGFFVTIVLIIILIILLFGGGKKAENNTGTTNSDKPATLQDIADTDSEVRMTIAGNVRANQDYFEIQVTSNRNQNMLQIIQGYEGGVIDTKTFNNNQSAFETFLRSLQKVGYMQGNDDKALADDRGFCPLGQRYIFEIIENGKIVQRYWTTSCGQSTPHTYLGRTSLTTQLFQMQIPEYNNLTSNVDF